MHILACTLWHGVRPEGMLAAHGPCHNPRCFNGAHLSWETHSENQRDRVRDQTSPRGEGHANAKLTEEIVRAIRARRLDGVSVSDLAVEFGVTRGTANNIVYRRSWKHI